MGEAASPTNPGMRVRSAAQSSATAHRVTTTTVRWAPDHHRTPPDDARGGGAGAWAGGPRPGLTTSDDPTGGSMASLRAVSRLAQTGQGGSTSPRSSGASAPDPARRMRSRRTGGGSGRNISQGRSGSARRARSASAGGATRTNSGLRSRRRRCAREETPYVPLLHSPQKASTAPTVAEIDRTPGSAPCVTGSPHSSSASTTALDPGSRFRDLSWQNPPFG